MPARRSGRSRSARLASSRRSLRLCRGASPLTCFAAVHESAFDAVDGSSTGTEVPWMWVKADIDRLEISQRSMSRLTRSVIGRNIADGGEFDSFSETDDRTGTLAKQSR